MFKGVSILSSCGHFVQRSEVFLSILVEDPSPKEHFCEIILKSGHKPSRRCCLKVFSILSSGSHFV